MKNQSQFYVAVIAQKGGIEFLHYEQVRSQLLKLALEIELERLRTGQLPERLEDLSDRLDPALLVDPYSGRPLRYDVLDTGFELKSAGPNERFDQTDDISFGAIEGT